MWFLRSPKGQGKGKSKGRRVKLEDAFLNQKKNLSHERSSCFGSAGWRCGAATSLAGAEPVATLAQACEKRGRTAGKDRKNEAVEEQYYLRGVGEQVITSFIKLQVLGARRRQNVHHAPSITDGSTPPFVENNHLLPRGSSMVTAG